MSEMIESRKGPAYPAAHAVAAAAHEHFARRVADARARGKGGLADTPDARTIEAIVDAAFWASLRREEGFTPKISLAFLSPEQAGGPLRFERQLPLEAVALARLAPAVERPGIHLGVWRDGDGLCVWGTTRGVPPLCFVLEVVAPGLLVVKYRRGRETGKYVNVAVLEGDSVKFVDERGTSLPDCPELLTHLLGFGAPEPASDSVNVLVQLAASMRMHGRGGSLLVAPEGSEEWRESIVRPVLSAAERPYSELAELMRGEAAERATALWQESLIDAVEMVAGLTAVDGAALINERYEVLAFGAKIARRRGGEPVERVVLTEPVVGDSAVVVSPTQLGGTRHMSAAQFVQDQQGAVALVASQDGRFTVFAWSPCEEMVHAHRVETLLL
jgi:hypothetical protein